MSNSENQFDVSDRSEIDDLATRAALIDRRSAFVATGRALAFAIPALLTFTVPARALSFVGSFGNGDIAIPIDQG